jgi:hypothetical protein
MKASLSGVNPRNRWSQNRLKRPYKAEVAGSRPAAPTRTRRSTITDAGYDGYVELEMLGPRIEP